MMCPFFAVDFKLSLCYNKSISKKKGVRYLETG